MTIGLETVELCRQAYESIKQAQLKRLREAGWSEEEAKGVWFKYRYNYLMNWKEFVDFGLVSLPEGLNKLILRVVNKLIEDDK